MKDAKPQLIILPGWGGSKVTWSGFTDIARQHFEVFVIELPCFGSVPCPDTIWGVKEYATYVKKQIEKLPKANVRILLGHSFGGQIAAYMVSKNLVQVSALVLAAAAVIRPSRYLKRVVIGGITRVVKPVVNILPASVRKKLYNAIGSPDYATISGVKAEIFRTVIRQDGQAWLKDITVPTCIIWGKRDRYTPVKDAATIHAHITNSRLCIIPNGTHGLHHNTKQLLLDEVRTFVSAL